MIYVRLSASLVAHLGIFFLGSHVNNGGHQMNSGTAAEQWEGVNVCKLCPLVVEAHSAAWWRESGPIRDGHVPVPWRGAVDCSMSLGKRKLWKRQTNTFHCDFDGQRVIRSRLMELTDVWWGNDGPSEWLLVGRREQEGTQTHDGFTVQSQTEQRHCWLNVTNESGWSSRMSAAFHTENVTLLLWFK